MAYADFAEIYDSLMTDIPYGAWCDYLEGLLKKYGVPNGLVAELGCGTGAVTERLAEKGYDMTGIDLSPEMLQKAIEKRDASGLPILYLNQDMRDFELYGTMAAFVSVCDSMNYLTEDADFVDTLRLVNNYLDPGGVFIFDLKTEHYFRETLGTTVQKYEEDGRFFVWDNEYVAEERLNYYSLTWFSENADGRYERNDEDQVQRAYSVDEVKKLAEDAGMTFVTAFRAFSEDTSSAEDDRIYIILKEKGKKIQ